jgi:hypothetical protein
MPVMELERRLFTLLLLVGLAVAGLAGACSGPDDGGPGAPGRGIYVPLSWQTARAVDGHQVHVVTHKVKCAACHALGADAIGPVVPKRCGECHAKETELVHAEEQARAKFGPGATSDCTSCHAFTVELGRQPAHATAQVHGPGDCARCHASASGDVPAVTVHHTEACTACHQPHDDAQPKSAPCETCHADITTEHAARGHTISEACVTCHQSQHARADVARATCVECHAREQPIVAKTALFDGGHRECVGCHRPHSFDAASSVECTSCHDALNVLGGARVAAHRACESCHAPHDVANSPAKACARCHTGVHPDHPHKGTAGTCVGCHDAHPSSAHASSRARACSTCHQVAAADDGFHAGVGCKKCHEPHHFVRALDETAICSTCHRAEVTHASTNAGHRACADCHRGLPHRPEALQIGCATCHGGVHAQAAQGHSDCVTCHEAHSGAVERECRSCHAVEHRAAPRGHQACLDCHGPHDGSVSKACASCHAEQAGTPHGKLRNNCSDCHRPHGPGGTASPPACSTCHAPAKLMGLHSVKQHGRCGDCHAPHGEPPGAMRSQCLECHQKQINHFVDAPNCASCHLFGEVH